MITWFALALATDVRATDDPVLAAIDRIAEASGRNVWAWYAEDPCGGHDPGLASRPEPGHPFAATMEVRRALAATQTLEQVVDTWNAAGGRRLVIDHDDSDRIVVTLMGLDETCTREIGPDPAFLQATIAPAMYVGGQGVEDMLAELPRPLETGVMVSANARWIVREPSTLIDALLRPAPGQLGRLTGIYSVKETGPLIWFGGSLRPPEPEELGPPPPLPRPTPAEKLLDQRRSYLRKVDTVAAGVHLALPSYAYTVDLIPSEAKDLADAEARWIDEHGELPYDPEEVVGYPIPEVNPVPVRTTGTFPLPAEETAEL